VAIEGLIGTLIFAAPLQPSHAVRAAYAVVQCPSVTFVYCVEMSKRRLFSIFSSCGKSTILVYSLQTLWQYSDGDPLIGPSNAGRYE